MSVPSMRTGEGNRPVVDHSSESRFIESIRQCDPGLQKTDAELRQFFRLMDVDGDGSLSTFTRVGIAASYDNVEQYLKDVLRSLGVGNLQDDVFSAANIDAVLTRPHTKELLDKTYLGINLYRLFWLANPEQLGQATYFSITQGELKSALQSFLGPDWFRRFTVMGCSITENEVVETLHSNLKSDAGSELDTRDLNTFYQSAITMRDKRIFLEWYANQSQSFAAIQSKFDKRIFGNPDKSNDPRLTEVVAPFERILNILQLSLESLLKSIFDELMSRVDESHKRLRDTISGEN